MGQKDFGATKEVHHSGFLKFSFFISYFMFVKEDKQLFNVLV